MADYPSTPQVVGSKESLDEGTVLELADSGKPRLRTFYTQTRRRITVVHDVDVADKDAILAFYAANKFVAFTIDWQGDTPWTTYTVRFVNAPQPVPYQGDGRYHVTCELVVV